MESLTLNLTARARRVSENGKDYLVAPMVLINPGVLAGSKGPLLYRPEDIKKSVPAWNGMPLVIYHPHDQITNEPLSAQDPVRGPEIIEKQGVGEVRKSRFDTRHRAEGWFDVEKLKKVSPTTLKSLQEGKPIELSTGLFTTNLDRVGNFKGRPYTGIATDFKPDHLAVLPENQVGACGLSDGCGVLVNQRQLSLSSKIHLLANANPEGCNQYGCGGSSPKSVAAERASTRAKEASDYAEGHPEKNEQAATESRYAAGMHREASELAKSKGDAAGASYHVGEERRLLNKQNEHLRKAEATGPTEITKTADVAKEASRRAMKLGRTDSNAYSAHLTAKNLNAKAVSLYQRAGMPKKAAWHDAKAKYHAGEVGKYTSGGSLGASIREHGIMKAMRHNNLHNKLQQLVGNAWTDAAREASAEARRANAASKSTVGASGKQTSALAASRDADKVSKQAEFYTAEAGNEKSPEAHAKALKMHEIAAKAHANASKAHLAAGNGRAAIRHSNASLAHEKASDQHSTMTSATNNLLHNKLVILANENPNRDEQGRFASGDGGGSKGSGKGSAKVHGAAKEGQTDIGQEAYRRSLESASSSRKPIPKLSSGDKIKVKNEDGSTTVHEVVKSEATGHGTHDVHVKGGKKFNWSSWGETEMVKNSSTIQDKLASLLSNREVPGRDKIDLTDNADVLEDASVTKLKKAIEVENPTDEELVKEDLDACGAECHDEIAVGAESPLEDEDEEVVDEELPKKPEQRNAQTHNTWSDAAREAAAEARKSGHAGNAGVEEQLAKYGERKQQAEEEAAQKKESDEQTKQARRYLQKKHQRTAKEHEEKLASASSKQPISAHGEQMLREGRTPGGGTHNQLNDNQSQEEGGPTMATVTLNVEEREAVVNGLIDGECCFEENEREVLNSLSDRTLARLTLNAKEMPKFIQDKIDAKKEKEEEEEPEVEEDEEVENDDQKTDEDDKAGLGVRAGKGTGKNESQATGKDKPMGELNPKPTDNQLSADDRQFLAIGRKVVSDRRASMINTITANARNPFDKKELNSMDFGQLEKLSQLAAVEDRTEVPGYTLNRFASYMGAAAGVGNLSGDNGTDDDILPIPTLNYAEISKANGKK